MARFQSQPPIHGDGGGYDPTICLTGETGGFPETPFLELRFLVIQKFQVPKMEESQNNM